MSKLRKRLRVWWRMFNHDDQYTGFLAAFRACEKREGYFQRMQWERRVEYVRKMAGGYPTGEKP